MKTMLGVVLALLVASCAGPGVTSSQDPDDVFAGPLLVDEKSDRSIRACGQADRPAVCATVVIRSVGEETVESGRCTVVHMVDGGRRNVGLGPRWRVNDLEPGEQVRRSGRAELSRPFDEFTFRVSCVPQGSRI
jgi:hypothetical protein